MRARHPGIALSACVLATVAACGGEAFTAGGPDGRGGEDASRDSPGALEDGSGDDAVAADAGGGDAVAGDAGGADAVAPDAVTLDAPAPPHDASSNDGSVGPPKLVFITSQVYSGDLGGLSGADSVCQKLAAQANHPGTFKAWLSSTAISARDRLTHSTGPYFLANGARVATDWAGLTSGTLVRPIDVTETGGAPPTPTVTCSNTILPAAWTATAPDGTLAGMDATCADWTSSGPTDGAYLGVATQTGPAWSNGCGSETPAGNSGLCGLAASLYCIEQ